MESLQTRLATAADIPNLAALEKACFETDRLSKRSFSYFIRQGHCSLIVSYQGQILAGYALVLYRKGTQLARLYSIAVSGEFRGKGVAQLLLKEVERLASEELCIFLRLEVRVDNDAAITLYKKLKYRSIGKVEGYYEDGADALQMEKSLTQAKLSKNPTKRYEQQTDFTCGPASLMMAMNKLQPDYEMGLEEEIQIWREATTVFMTSGHGGCSGFGLALSAWRRGFKVHLYNNQTSVPFINSVRDPQKKVVIEQVHQHFIKQLEHTDVLIRYSPLTLPQLDQYLSQGAVLVSLISMWRLTRDKAPHWVLVSAANQDCVTITDPERDREPWQTELDFTDVPVERQEFIRMASFGRDRLTSTLVIYR
ncbi:GNAT family N-acetyltransferase/peptidase C39 family protein [Aliiglaciecola sp. CAU 1673]|uniref:GNAT family N-acetyltransferase/peptidase C39 family protein n=1 Tax=Aliiglaciecola sp. CAU 1673 TaxID=3032595 RepID=UPI0023D9FD01|nr:GNAT family N-acetyltransferase/peptidase C39 family protein [Aliiglaciecola sp. CAU 1673]MDF2177708.1 GNAT family N-acetyltransferase/peptidase C39 family protein [Aliiglaciecola sp. CAU 1673]